jgi:hypothetical protein
VRDLLLRAKHLFVAAIGRRSPRRAAVWARDEIDKTFGVGFAASRAFCRRLRRPRHSNGCAPQSLQWPPFVRCGAGADIAGIVASNWSGLDGLIAVAAKLCQWSGP